MLTLNEILFILVISIPFLLIPTAIGWYRQHPRLGALAALNVLGLIFFGIGWILALIWAVTEAERDSAAVAAEQPQSDSDKSSPY